MLAFWSRYLSLVPAGARERGADEAGWRLLTTLPDLPSAQSLAQVLTGAGIPARVAADAGILGQAAPSRIYVDAQLLGRAREYLAQGGNATEAAPADDEPA